MNRIRGFALLFILGGVTSLLTGGAWAQSQLPADIQADLLKRQIVEALRGRDFASALRAFDDYKKLNVPLPPALQFMEAKVAAEVGDDLRALEALTKTMPGLDRDSSQYKEALALLPEYQARADRATRRQRELARQEALKSNLSAVTRAQGAGDLVPGLPYRS